jgi:hypothetical protein
MRIKKMMVLGLLPIAAGAGVGCQSPKIIHGKATGFIPEPDDRVILAGEFAQGPAATPPVASQPTSQPAKEDTQRFTSPGSAVRQLSLFGVMVISGATGQLADGPVNAGDLSASSLGTDLSGRLGLSAPQSFVISNNGASLSLLSREGLQQGSLLALSTVRRGQAGAPIGIFHPQLSPLSGRMGQCQALVNAGFFNGSVTACERHFGR